MSLTHLYTGGKGATRPYPFCGSTDHGALCQHVAIHETTDPAMRAIVERDRTMADCPACLRIRSVYELTFKQNAEWKS